MAKKTYSTGAVMKTDNKRTNKKRIKLGDVIEVVISDNKWSYVQYVYNHNQPPHLGTLIRVFPLQYTNQILDYDFFDTLKESFVVFCPVATYVRRGIMNVICNRPVPDCFATMPTFRAPLRNISTGKTTWWLWDGVNEVYIGTLDSETITLPIRQLINYEELKNQIVASWTPAQDI